MASDILASGFRSLVEQIQERDMSKTPEPPAYRGPERRAFSRPFPEQIQTLHAEISRDPASRTRLLANRWL